MFDDNSTKSAVVLRVNMRCMLCVAMSQTSKRLWTQSSKKCWLEQRASKAGKGHVNPQYNYGLGRIIIKHHLTGKAHLISNSTKP